MKCHNTHIFIWWRKKKNVLKTCKLHNNPTKHISTFDLISSWLYGPGQIFIDQSLRPRSTNTYIYQVYITSRPRDKSIIVCRSGPSHRKSPYLASIVTWEYRQFSLFTLCFHTPMPWVLFFFSLNLRLSSSPHAVPSRYPAINILPISQSLQVKENRPNIRGNKYLEHLLHPQ